MAKTGLFGGGNGQTPPFMPSASPVFSNPGSVFRRGEGGILPERGSRAQHDMVSALLASGLKSSQGSGSPLLAFLTPMISGAVGARTSGLYKDAQAGRDKTATDALLAAMGGPAAPSVLPGSRNPAYSAMAANGGPTRAAAEAMNPTSMDERELLARTIQAEAGGEGLKGMTAVGAVMNNRVAAGGKYGDGIRGVILKPGQFSAWNGITGYAGGQGGLDMASITPSQHAYQVADMVLSGNIPDPTNGATHYYNPAAANPKWGTRSGNQFNRIGNHVFGAPEGRVHTPARDAAQRIASGDFSTMSGFGQKPPMSQDNMRALIGIMTDQEVSEPIRSLASSMLGDAMGNRSGMAPGDQIDLVTSMLGLETALQDPNASGRYRPATPEEAAQYGAEAGQIGPDGRFYPSTTKTDNGEAAKNRQVNEATQTIEGALAGLMTTGLTREEAMAEIARDPIYAPQLRMLGIDPADLTKKRVVEESKKKTGEGRGLFSWLFGGAEAAPSTPPAAAPQAPADPLGIR